MSHKFFANAETARVDLGDGEWVDIKAQLSVADQDALAQKLFEVEMVGFNREERRRLKNSGGTPPIRYKYSTVALLIVGLVDWSLKGDDGNKIPITEATVGSLLPEVAAKIYDAIDQRNPFGAGSSP